MADVVKRLFLSHADTDSALARVLHDELVRTNPSLTVFVSSIPGAIPAGKVWLTEIKRELRAADAYLVLLTASSIGRLWVWFESGSAFMSDRSVLGVCVPGLKKSVVPAPLSGHQLLSFHSPDECAAVFAHVGVKLANPTDFFDRVRTATEVSEAQRLSESGWIGLEFGKGFFAWDGPLDDLTDREAIPCPPTLPDRIREQGLTPSFGNRDSLGHSLAKGRLQVFKTDKQSWKRAVVNDGGQLLLVRGGVQSDASELARQLAEKETHVHRRSSMLHSALGDRAADAAFEQVAGAAESLIRSLGVAIEMERVPRGFVMRYERKGRVTVEWIQPWANNCDQARLCVAQWALSFPPRRFSLDGEQPLQLTEFAFDVDGNGVYAWRSITDGTWHDHSSIADWSVEQLLKLAGADSQQG